MTDEASGTYELFLADDTVEFQGVCKKKKEISSDTLKWLDFYYSLSESDRNALSMIPSEFLRSMICASFGYLVILVRASAKVNPTV